MPREMAKPRATAGTDDGSRPAPDRTRAGGVGPDGASARTAPRSAAAPQRPDVEELLDELLHDGERVARRRAFDRLLERGPAAATAAIRRLERTDLPWYAKRNLLALLAELRSWPPEWSIGPYVDHYHPAVRREAYKIVLGQRGRRDWALCGLLEESDPRCLALGLAAAREEAPAEAIPLLAALAGDEGLAVDLRSEAVRALAAHEVPDSRIYLLELVRRDLDVAGWLRRRLRPERVTAVTLAALRGLGRWKEHPEVARLLRRARRSKDARIRAAAGGETAA